MSEIRGQTGASTDPAGAPMRDDLDMTIAVRGPAALRWRAVLLGAVVLATLAGTAVALDARGHGMLYGATSRALLLPLAAAIISTAAAALWLAGHVPSPVARAMAITCAWLLAYLLLIAAAVQYAGVAGRRGPVAELLVALHGAGALVPVAVLQLCLMTTLIHVVGERRTWSRFRTALIALTTLYLGAALVLVPPGAPYDDIHAMIPSPVMEVLTSVVGTAIWIAAVVVGPLLIWRAMSAARGDIGRRLSLLAALAVTPVVMLAFCIIAMSLVLWTDLMNVGVGEALLAVTYCVPFLLASVVVPVVLTPKLSPRATGLIPKVVATTVTVVVGLFFGIVIVTASALLGAGLGTGTVLGIVVLTFTIAAILTPVRARLTRHLVVSMDPGRSVAARLMRRLDDSSRASPAEAAQDILRRSLGDPAARLVISLPDGRGWVDVARTRVQEPPPGATAVSNASGEPLAYVVHDGPVDEAAGVIEEVHTLIDHAVLEVTIREQSDRVAAEKERADSAVAAERQRLERDLHDGVQGRLLALALDLRMAQRTLSDGEAQLVLADASDGLQRAIEELRSLAAGATPELLSVHGLGPAIAELSRRLPVPVSVSVPDQRLSPPAETVAYLVICEAVTNALKHAEAESISVQVEVESGIASIEVSDDGRGGADLRAGTGLRGVSERVGAAGGRLVISQRRPRGTTVEVTLPCD